MKKTEILALKQEKNDLIDRKKTILETAINEVRSMNDEETQELRSVEEQIEDLTLKITTAEEELQKRSVAVDQIKGEDKYMKTQAELRSEFLEKIAEKNGEVGSMEVEARTEGYNVGMGDAPYNSATKGQANVPLTIQESIIRAIDFNSNVLPLANIIRTGGTQRLVLDVAPASEARLVKEGAPISTVDSEFRKVELSAHKYAEIVKFTREVVEDTNFNIMAHASQRLGMSFAKAFEKAIVTGTGSAQPQGLLAYTADNDDLQKASEHVTASKDAISLSDVTNAYYNLPHECRQNAIFLCHPSVVRALALIEDANGRAILKPDYTGEFLTIFGKRIVECPYMGEMGQAGAKVAMFVDVNRALTVGLRTDVSVRQLHEVYAVNDMVALVGVARIDSKLTQEGAISAIKVGA